MISPRFKVIDIEDEIEIKKIEPLRSHKIRRLDYCSSTVKEKEKYFRFTNESGKIKEDLVCKMFVEEFAEKNRLRWMVIRILNKFFPNYCAISPLQRVASQLYFNSER